MAWHKIGNRYYSDAERQVIGNQYFQFLVDVCLPGYLTYLGVTYLAAYLELHYHFFFIHTTTAKLVYIVAGVFIFSIAYSFRIAMIALAFLAICCVLGLATLGTFFQWLFT